LPSGSRVRAGELDAAFVRALTTAPGLELLPMWQDPLTVALPATHALAAQPAIQLPQLAGIPLRLAPRHDNPPFHDLILDACAEVGFQPLPGPPFTTLQDTLAEIGTGPASWTVLYTAAGLTPVRRVAFRPLAGLTTQTCLAVPPGPPAPALRRLLSACAAANPGQPRHKTETGRGVQEGRRSRTDGGGRWAAPPPSLRRPAP
jgi:LysR substrate binding domain